jgi:hypothetical protein
MSWKRPTILALGVLAAGVAAVATGAVGPSARDAAACQFFPSNNPWNQRVDGQPVHAGSRAVINHFGRNTSVFADFSMPYVTVPASQRRVPVRFHYWRESDRGRYPIPPNAPIEPGTPDRHVIVLDRDRCRLYELYKARRRDGGLRWRAGAGAIWNLRVNHFRPRGWTSADAAGLPILPGLLKYEEVSADRLHHALRFTIPQVRRAYTAPASHCGQYADDALPPYGTRVRLKASFPLDDYSGDALVILIAMKRYGLMLADQGSAWYVTGTSNPAWEDALDQLREFSVRGSDFEVLASGPVTAC